MTPDSEAKFSVGSIWRTRDGRKVKVIDPIGGLSEDPLLVKFVDEGFLACYQANGRVFKNVEHCLDLIELWTEPQQTTMTYEQGEKIIKLLEDLCGGVVILMQQGDKK